MFKLCWEILDEKFIADFAAESPDERFLPVCQHSAKPLATYSGVFFTARRHASAVYAV